MSLRSRAAKVHRPFPSALHRRTGVWSEAVSKQKRSVRSLVKFKLSLETVPAHAFGSVFPIVPLMSCAASRHHMQILWRAMKALRSLLSEPCKAWIGFPKRDNSWTLSMSTGGRIAFCLFSPPEQLNSSKDHNLTKKRDWLCQFLPLLTLAWIGDSDQCNYHSMQQVKPGYRKCHLPHKKNSVKWRAIQTFRNMKYLVRNRPLIMRVATSSDHESQAK